MALALKKVRSYIGAFSGYQEERLNGKAACSRDERKIGMAGIKKRSPFYAGDIRERKKMKQTILLGGYTNRVNRGIAQITLDTEKKALEDYSLICELEKPTYLIKKEGDIYSCIKGGMVKIRNGQPEKRLSLEGASPCHISADPSRPFFYLSDYHQGTLYVVEETENALLERYRIAHQGSSVHPNQEKSHIHFAEMTPCGKYLLVCDLGTDEVYSYRPQEDGSLQEHFRVKLPAGFGPRHLTFHPEIPLVYVLGELSSQIMVLAADPGTGMLWQKQIIVMLPESFKDFNAGAAIRISADGKYLYASNRGHDSIAVFSVKENGLLQLEGHTPTCGKTPRDFALSPEGDFLVAAHQDSDGLTLFARDKMSGKLTLCQKEIYAPECVCVCF